MKLNLFEGGQRIALLVTPVAVVVPVGVDEATSRLRTRGCPRSNGMFARKRQEAVQ